MTKINFELCGFTDNEEDDAAVEVEIDPSLTVNLPELVNEVNEAVAAFLRQKFFGCPVHVYPVEEDYADDEEIEALTAQAVEGDKDAQEKALFAYSGHGDGVSADRPAAENDAPTCPTDVST